MKRKANPMHARFGTPKCMAKTRLGTCCQAPAVLGKARCRMHGGAEGSGAPRGPSNGQYRHGRYTCDAIAERRLAREVMDEALTTLAQLNRR